LAVKFNELAQRAGLAGFVQSMGMQMDSVVMVGAVVRWFVRLIALVVAFDALGLPAVSEVLRQVLLWLPNVVVAMVILVVAGLAANALGKLVRGTASESGLRNADLLGRIATALVMGFGVIVAIGQLGIATLFVDALFVRWSARWRWRWAWRSASARATRRRRSSVSWTASAGSSAGRRSTRRPRT